MIALVTGGASCGKSAYAERLCTELGDNRVYLAAMRPFGEEGAARVRKHRAQRAGKGFTTIECYEGLDLILDDGRLEGATALLECLGNVVANEMFDAESPDAPPCGSRGERVCVRVVAAFDVLVSKCAHVVVVGNEIGADGIAYPDETREYQSILGRVSQALAARADLVVECVAGIPLELKGTMR